MSRQFFNSHFVSSNCPTKTHQISIRGHFEDESRGEGGREERERDRIAFLIQLSRPNDFSTIALAEFRSSLSHA